MAPCWPVGLQCSSAAVIPLLRMLHFGSLCVWAGVVAVEAVIEIQAWRQPELRSGVARLHARIDLFVELPTIIAVATSGAALLAAIWPPSALHVAKIGLALGLQVDAVVFGGPSGVVGLQC